MPSPSQVGRIALHALWMVCGLNLSGCGASSSVSKLLEPENPARSKPAPRAEKPRPLGGAAQPPPNLGPWEQAWTQRRALSCELRLKIQQGPVSGLLSGRIAWSRGDSKRLRAHVQGRLGDKACRVRVTSLSDTLLFERWVPGLDYAMMRRFSADQTARLLDESASLGEPMVASLLREGCAESVSAPLKERTWNPKQAQNHHVMWTSGAGEQQELWTQGPKRFPQRRLLTFTDKNGSTVRWDMELSCNGA